MSVLSHLAFSPLHIFQLFLFMICSEFRNQLLIKTISCFIGWFYSVVIELQHRLKTLETQMETATLRLKMQSEDLRRLSSSSEISCEYRTASSGITNVIIGTRLLGRLCRCAEQMKVRTAAASEDVLDLLLRLIPPRSLRLQQQGGTKRTRNTVEWRQECGEEAWSTGHR